MGELELATVAAANDAWGGTAPLDAEVVETAEYRMVRMPERFGRHVMVQWVRSARQADAVLADLAARAAEFGRPDAWVTVRLSAPAGLDEALLARGAELGDTYDVLAMPLPAELKAPDLPELRWATTVDIVRDVNTVATAMFGGTKASEDILAQRTVEEQEKFAAGAGSALAAYVDGMPVGVGSLELVDGVARLAGSGVLESHRGRGIYRAMVAARLTYAEKRGATMALSQGNITTSSPILRRLGFVAYGQERSYRLPLTA
ncbi:GNAT family N-acetyltransferase [Kribbella italica]|uniref:Ribosomal protein S18 acetylase RimI-like enzyme n=1 Tax=Kribbella italica TaxID=1540520 RepID=A0A7W9J393_9ACTN|nr:GNAT family N-acetyltransferase [Kribbella italica]MBB5834816.1 ribosomal protein S18 acetylase RimI-like enzyme [Kribbella italica]